MMFTIDKLTEFWARLDLNQHLILLTTTKIKTIQCYNIRDRRLIERQVKDLRYGADNIHFRELRKKQQEKLLNYVNKTPTKYKSDEPIRIQLEFDFIGKM